ncbi:MAG: DUF2231 domain-containing protein [Gaiellaceae bacterium]
MDAKHVITGSPGHPLHPPFTDLTIGTYAFAAIAAVLQTGGVLGGGGAYAWWIALVVGLAVTLPTAVTGFADWVQIRWGSELWKTATAHLTAMLTASGIFLAAALAGRADYAKGVITTPAFVLTLVGFSVLTLGGWLGGTVVFVHGMRVLGREHDSWLNAIAPFRRSRREP